ncbi:MAG: sulfatase-like hydrolase/transferase, partial [Opitutaceae bacterium]|nr:sulfatase-like hydrolase/transferase [Opitutaceae bacterium]
NGVRDYFDPLPPGTRTIAHELKDRGYATAFFGKWHLAERDPAAALVGEAHARMIVPPEMRGGFEFWEGFESGFLLNDPWLHGTRLPEPVQRLGYQSDVVCERAAGWLREQPTANGEEQIGPPFFAVVSLEAPHPPYEAPAAGIARRPVELAANVPLAAEARARRELAGYYAHIEATDRAIGRLLAAQHENTRVIFTSVHGDMHGAHGLFRKGWPYEESVRVPLLVKSPEPKKSGGIGSKPRVDNSPVSLLDIPAMTLAWAAGEAWRNERARAVISMPSVVQLPWQCDRAWRGLRSSKRKLVLDETGKPWLFFDLEQDPLELHNLVAEASRADELTALVRQLD